MQQQQEHNMDGCRSTAFPFQLWHLNSQIPITDYGQILAHLHILSELQQDRSLWQAI